MLNTLLILCAFALLAGLLVFEKKEDRKGMLPVKTVLSCLFILTAWVQPHPLPTFSLVVLAGLVCCLAGDVFLALPQEKMFLLGLVSFLFGHIFYVIAFFLISVLNLLTWLGGALTCLVSFVIFVWLKPHLGAMKGPVICYILVISAMIIGAWTILGTPQLAVAGKLMLFGGAVSFYLSDILVARNRFVKNEFFNRLVGLPLYYLGQFLIAFSLGVIG